MLLAAGADINHKCNDGSAALSDAAYRQNVEAAKSLIENGADVSNRDSQGYTALSWACGRGVPESDIVELLLRHGADVNDLYRMDCVLQYLDYDNCYAGGMPREIMLRPQDLQERYLYEHAIIPVMLTASGKQKYQSQGFFF